MSIKARIEIFRPGDYGYGFEWTPDMVAAMARNYNAEWHKSPVVIGHDDDDTKDAVGWATGMAFDGASLWADVEITDDETVERVRSKGLQYVSAEVHPNFHGIGPYVFRVSLLGAMPPRVKGMKPLEFSDRSFSSVTPAIPPDNTQENPLMDKEQIEQVSEGIFSRLMGKLNKPIKFSDTPEPGADAALSAANEKIAALEKENADLKAKFADAEKAKAEADAAKKESEASNFADDQVKTKGIAPAHRESIKAFCLATDATRAAAFADGLPKVNPNLTVEKTATAGKTEADDPAFAKFADTGTGKTRLNALTEKFKDAGMARAALLDEWKAARSGLKQD